MTSVENYLREFQQYRGFRPDATITTDAYGAAHIQIPGFAEVTISRDGRCDMPKIKSFPEGGDYVTQAKPGWPTERGAAAKMACIFADFYRNRERGDKPPYFLFTPGEWLLRRQFSSRPERVPAATEVTPAPQCPRQPLPAGSLGQACQRLALILGSLAVSRRDKLERLKEDARELERPDFVWHSLVESFSSMGNSRGYEGLFVKTDLYGRITWEALSSLSSQERRRVLAQTLRAATVRMPDRKAEWLSSDFERIVQLGGPAAVKAQLLSQQGREAKIVSLEQFDGIGPKYARNIFMNVYHPEFRDSIAVDERIKGVSKQLGLSFGSYEDEEQFYLDAAHAAKLSGWELDRLLYWFNDEVVRHLNAFAVSAAQS
jgi:endonuclease III